jgi:hypothetical protein
MWITVPAFLAIGIFATNRFHLRFGHASHPTGFGQGPTLAARKSSCVGPLLPGDYANSSRRPE